MASNLNPSRSPPLRDMVVNSEDKGVSDRISALATGKERKKMNLILWFHCASKAD
jgi:hypothetical protein